MKTLIVYDSTFGNTEKIAQEVGKSIGGQVTVSRASAGSVAALAGMDLLVVASPTVGGRPTPAVQKFLTAIPPAGLSGIKVAAFDTRIPMKFARMFGYAADKIAAALVKSGGDSIASPEGFLVSGRQGPLADKELERAAGWARRIAGSGA